MTTKNIIKTIAIIAIVVFTFALTGCSELPTEPDFNTKDYIASVVDAEFDSTPSVITSEVEEIAPTIISTIETTKSEENITETTTSTTEVITTTKVTTTTEATTTTKPAVKPVEKVEENISTTTTTAAPATEKPVEYNVHTHNFSKATCEKPATCTTCGATNGNALGHNFTSATCVNPAICKTCGITKGTVIDHNYYNGTCTMCGANDPNYIAPHNCDIDGHIWGNDYTEVVEEQGEIVETHHVSGCGYDYTLAYEYFGRTSSDVDLSAATGFGPYGSGTTDVKTTGTKTITNYYHECSECGFKELYNTEEIVIPGDTWEFVYGPQGEYYPVVWYDINNVPSEIIEGAKREKAAVEEWLKSLM